MEMFKYIIKESALGILAALCFVGIFILGAVIGDALIGMYL